MRLFVRRRLAQSWTLMRLFVRRRFSFIPWLLWKQTHGKSNRFQNGGCHESKLQLDLNISADIHPQSTKSESTVAVKILTASYLNKVINIHNRVNYFPHHFLWVLQTDFSLRHVSPVGFLEIDFWQVYCCRHNISTTGYQYFVLPEFCCVLTKKSRSK